MTPLKLGSGSALPAWLPRRGGHGAVFPRARVARLAVAVNLMLWWSLSLLSPVRAESGAWSEPVRVSLSEQGREDWDWFPDVAADDAGNVHIVWNRSYARADVPDQRGTLEYVRWDGQSWTRQNDIAVDWFGAALRSSLVADTAGRLHLVYLGYGQLERSGLSFGGVNSQDLWYTNAPGTTAHVVQAWQTPVRMTRAPQGYFSDLAIDSRGVIHAIWTESSAGRWGLYYSRSSDGGATWSTRIPLESEGFVWWYRAHLQGDPLGRLHVVWETTEETLGGVSLGFGTSSGAAYVVSTDGGETWRKTQFGGRGTALRADGASIPGPQQPSVGIDGSGTVLLVYREPGTNRLMFRRSADGEVWSPEQLIPGVKAGIARPFDIYSMATDSAGHVHLVMVAVPNGADTMSLLHSEWDGQSWSKPSVIASAPPYPEYPRIAIGRGNRLHVVWFDGDKSTDRTPNKGIWYSTALTSAPATVSQGTPPPITGATPRPSPTPVPARSVAGPAGNPKSVLQADSLDEPGVLGNLRAQATLPLVAGTVPVLVILGVVLGVRLGLKAAIRRRLEER